MASSRYGLRWRRKFASISTVKLDGEVAREGDINENEASVWIGKKKQMRVSGSMGVLDELRILNVAITEEQIQADMEDGIALCCGSYWKNSQTTWGTD